MAEVSMKDVRVNLEGNKADTLFFTPSFTETDLRSICRVIPNVVNKKNVGFVGNMDKIVRANGGCGFTPIGNLSMYEREVEVFKMKFDVEECWEKFVDTIYEDLMAKGLQYVDLTPTIFTQILVDRIKDAVKRDNIRLAFFGNKASLDGAYNSVNGFWTNIKKYVTANQAPVQAVTNGVYAPGEATDLLRSMYKKQPRVLKNIPTNQKVWLIDDGTWEAYREDLEADSSGQAVAGVKLLQDGTEMLNYRGIKLTNMQSWGDIMASDFGAADAKLALLTTPQNLLLPTDTMSGETSMKIRFDEDEEKIKISGRYKMGGIDILHPSLTVTAYQ